MNTKTPESEVKAEEISVPSHWTELVEVRIPDTAPAWREGRSHNVRTVGMLGVSVFGGM